MDVRVNDTGHEQVAVTVGLFDRFVGKQSGVRRALAYNDYSVAVDKHVAVARGPVIDYQCVI